MQSVRQNGIGHTPPPPPPPPIASQQIREGFKSDKTEAQLLLNGKIPKIKSSQRVKSPLPTNMSSSIHPLINPSTHPSATFVPPSSPASAAGGKRQCATSDRTRLRWFWNHHRTTKFTTTTRLPLHRCVVPRMRGAALECTSPGFFPQNSSSNMDYFSVLVDAQVTSSPRVVL